MLGAVLALGGCHNLSGGEKQQAEVIDAFYRIHLQTAAPGLPTPDELKQLQPLLSPALSSLLMRAEAAQERQRAQAGTGAQVAPLVEGDLFTSLYEGATGFSVASCDTDEDGTRAACQVDLRHDKDGADESWHDKVLLVRQDRQWRIDDIEFIGHDQSSQREYLTDTLTDALQQAE